MAARFAALVGLLFVLFACSSPADDASGQADAACAVTEAAAIAFDAGAAIADVVAIDAQTQTDDAPIDVIAPTDGAAQDAAQEAEAAAPLKPRVFAYGNSLTYGVGATNIATTSYPARLAAALGSRWQADAWRGRSGWGGAQLVLAAKYDLPQYTAETSRTRRVLVFWEGTNELGALPCDSYEVMTRARVAEGWTVVLLTTLPTTSTASVTSDGGTTSGVWVTRRLEFNQCVRDNFAAWGATAIVDVGADPMLQNPWNSSYFVDGVHLTDVGYQRIADAVAPVVDALYLAP